MSDFEKHFEEANAACPIDNWPDLENHSAWVGYSTGKDFFGAIDVWEDSARVGFFHAEVRGDPTGSVATRRPVRLEGLRGMVGVMLNLGLVENGITVRWKKTSKGFAKLDSLTEPPKLCDESSDLQEKDDAVYFLKAGPFLKIGKASGDPTKRVSSFQTGNPYELELLSWIPGGLKRESELHKRFSHLHYRGEWFHYESDLMEFVGSLAGGCS